MLEKQPFPLRWAGIDSLVVNDDKRGNMVSTQLSNSLLPLLCCWSSLSSFLPHLSFRGSCVSGLARWLPREGFCVRWAVCLLPGILCDPCLHGLSASLMIHTPTLSSSHGLSLCTSLSLSLSLFNSLSPSAAGSLSLCGLVIRAARCPARRREIEIERNGAVEHPEVAGAAHSLSLDW